MSGFIWKAAILLVAAPLHILSIASDFEQHGPEILQDCTGFVQGHDDQALRNQLSIDASIHFSDSPQFGNLVWQSDILSRCLQMR